MLRSFQSIGIKSVLRITEDAAELTLDVPEELHEAFRFQAGQYLTFKTFLN